MSDINSYVWKDARLTKDRNEKQIETRLIDMDEDQLQMVYSHSKDMLYNNDPKNAGRMIVIDQIAKQLDYCSAELALRYLKSQQDKDGNLLNSNESIITELRAWLAKGYDENCEIQYLYDKHKIPSEFKHVTIKSLQLACRDALGYFDHSKITYSFIYKLGIYLTQEELKAIDNDLIAAGLNPESYTLQAKIDNHIKTPLRIFDVDLHVNPKGLTETEFSDMINMKRLKGRYSCKYSSLSTSQLRTLRSKVLFSLEERTKWQASKWREIMAQIEEVAEYKGYKLN